MRSRRRLLTTTIALLTVPFALAAAGASAAAAAATAAGPAASHRVVVSTTSSKFGRVLVTGSGVSLYVFSGDGFPFSPSGMPQLACTALNKAPNGTPCTTAWPPLVATGRLVARHGVRQSKLGTVTRNGVKQVTYFGKPVYAFIGDTAAGQKNGEDITAFDGTFFLDRASSGRPAVGIPTVQTETSPNGIVLSSPTANGTRSLYLLTADATGKTACTGACAALWPPLLTSKSGMAGAAAGPGVRKRLIGTIRRPGGSLQVTYRGHPVYFFAFDLGAGAASGLTNGQYLLDPAPVDGVWYTVLPQGTPDPGTTTVGSESSASGPILSITAGFTHVTATLYSFSADTTTASKCSGACAIFWPPVLTTTAPIAAGGAMASKLGVIPRADGTFQVTYNGHPLYFFAPALNGTTSGDNVKAFGGIFHIVQP
jgi:predicted lipoprotein with Yx(FWY)xxD motif